MRSNPTALSFVNRCLSLSPCERATSSELLSNCDYFKDLDFQRVKENLLERIRRFNQPTQKIVKKSKEQNEYKFSHVSSSTSKLQHLKNYRSTEQIGKGWKGRTKFLSFF